MPRNKKKGAFKPTPELEDVMVTAKAMGYTDVALCEILNISISTLGRTLKRDAALSEKIRRAKPLADLKVHQSLYNAATKKGDVRAMEFYLKTKCGARTTDRIEHTGPDGRPIQMNSKAEITTNDPSRAEILAEMKEIQERIEASLKGE